jgi:hypothetical protein
MSNIIIGDIEAQEVETYKNEVIYRLITHKTITTNYLKKAIGNIYDGKECIGVGYKAITTIQPGMLFSLVFKTVKNE